MEAKKEGRKPVRKEGTNEPSKTAVEGIKEKEGR